MELQALQFKSLDIKYIGTPLSEGPMPCVFYFALCAEESLMLEPFNTPVKHWVNHPLRIFSVTIPKHGEGFDKRNAIIAWAEDFRKGLNPLTDFLNDLEEFMAFLFDSQGAEAEKVVLAGLSRGACIATHLAARDERLKYVLGFAPLTGLARQEAFSDISEDPIVNSLSLYHLAPKLTHKHCRYYISNYDTLVGTDRCFDFIQKCTLIAIENKVRSPQFELNIYPPIGYKGHGTPAHIFEEGALWAKEQITESY